VFSGDSLAGFGTWHCTRHNGQRWDHSTRWRGLLWQIQTILGKKNDVQQRLWSLLWAYDHHWKIMSHNVVKKMTQSAIPPDCNVFRWWALWFWQGWLTDDDAHRAYLLHWHKISSVSGRHFIQWNFSSAKGKAFWKVKCSLMLQWAFLMIPT